MQRAAQVGISVVAITDHDTIDGVPRAIEEGERLGVRVIPGVEVTGYYGRYEVHIVGLFIAIEPSPFTLRLAEIREFRLKRLDEIVGRLNGLGVDISAEDVFEVGGRGTLGRAHVADAIIRHGYARNVAEVFDLYLGIDGPAYVPKIELTVREATDLIRLAGGVPVLAHPGTLNHDEWIDEFASQGLEGLEAYTPNHSESEVIRYLGIARRLRLAPSGGSDCHGMRRDEVRLGKVRLDLRLVEELEKRKPRH